MSLSDLASLGSFVNGLAVLISLIYLALQVRQTNRNQQIAIRHIRASRIVELQLALADPGVAGARLSARSPGWRAAWKIARPNFGGRFRDFMDGVVAASAVEPAVDVSLEAWKAAFASEVSRT
jgi:hypothetical protein